MAYYIDQRIWDDEKFLSLEDPARILFVLLLTGPQRSSLPGLQRGTVISLSETLKRCASEIERAMRSLELNGMAIVDRKARVICLPNAPKYTIPPTANHLKGWWFAWQELPTCQEKINHVPRLQKAINLANNKVRHTWEQTFNKVLTHRVDHNSSYAGFSMTPPNSGARVVQLSDERAHRSRKGRASRPVSAVVQLPVAQPTRPDRDELP